MAQDQSAFGEESIGFLGRAALVLREMNEHEIRRTRRHWQAELANLVRQPGQPARIVRPRPINVGCITDCRDPRGNRRTIDVEWSTNAIDAIDHMRWAIHPAKAQRG